MIQLKTDEYIGVRRCWMVHNLELLCSAMCP